MKYSITKSITLLFGRYETNMLYIFKENNDSPENIVFFYAQELEKQVKAGRAKSIGLSNFNQSQVSNVYDNAEIKPSNLQVSFFFNYYY